MDKKNIGNYINKACAPKLIFKIFTWKSHFSQPLLSKGSRIMHISNPEIRKLEDILGITFQSWALQVSWFPQPKILFSIVFDLQAFPMSEHLFDSTRDFWDGRTIKENSFISFFSLPHQKLSLFLCSLFSFNVTKWPYSKD